MIAALDETQYEDKALRWRLQSDGKSLWHEFPLPRQPNIQTISTQVCCVHGCSLCPTLPAQACLAAVVRLPVRVPL